MCKLLPDRKEKGYQYILYILAVDVGLLIVGHICKDKYLSFAISSIGVVTFLGVFAVFYEPPGLALEQPVRLGITASVIATYLAVVGIAVFGSPPQANDVSNKIIEHLQKVVSIVLAAYFGSSFGLEAIGRFKGEKGKLPEDC